MVQDAHAPTARHPAQPGVSAAAAAADPAGAAAQAAAGVVPGMWQAANYGIMWNMPQWNPTTSMALYLPAAHVPLQYAGQQGPEMAGVPGSQVRVGFPLVLVLGRAEVSVCLGECFSVCVCV
jgi:hypothetical protein